MTAPPPSSRGAGRILFTVVATERGAKAISDITIGECVWSWDEEQQKRVLSKVTRIYVHPARALRLRAGEEVLRTTDEHPFWVEGKGWARAADLSIGARLRSQGGEALVSSNSLTETATVFSGYEGRRPVVMQPRESSARRSTCWPRGSARRNSTSKWTVNATTSAARAKCWCTTSNAPMKPGRAALSGGWA